MSASGARRGYREFARMAQGSSPEEERDSPEDYRGQPKSLSRKARWEYVGRSLEEDRKTHRMNAKGYRIGRRFSLHTKKIGSGRRCASRRRTREWT
ncbi:hypothetical protein B296_00051001 [Ensete ventricosum]|uniref:Uncharacterized protein n=1 Tax=Ensete ventricosum TaxID=4639 RepID=A0A426X8X4_ENSVE|nr:hypothetical protein B296_00051001 [Ensete ventricosum]